MCLSLAALNNIVHASIDFKGRPTQRKFRCLAPLHIAKVVSAFQLLGGKFLKNSFTAQLEGNVLKGSPKLPPIQSVEFEKEKQSVSTKSRHGCVIYYRNTRQKWDLETLSKLNRFIALVHTIFIQSRRV